MSVLVRRAFCLKHLHLNHKKIIKMFRPFIVHTYLPLILIVFNFLKQRLMKFRYTNINEYGLSNN